MDENQDYVAPAVERLGTVADLTEGSDFPNGDHQGQTNTAYS